MANCNKECCHTQDDHDHTHGHEFTPQEIFKEMIFAIVSFVILFAGIIMDHINVPFFEQPYVTLLWYSVPFFLVGLPVIKEALVLIFKYRDFFNELTLMSIAMIGAIAIGEYAEGIGIMVFYTIGEVVQGMAVAKSRNNIKALLDVRPDVAYLVKGDGIESMDPEDVQIDDIIEIRTGEKVPLDGILLTEKAFFNTAALTGESVPRGIKQNEEVLAGMLSSEKTVRVKVTKLYSNSTLARILKMVQDATENKSPTEQFIRKFARVYTPVVFSLATLVVIIPFFVLGDSYRFTDWFYRSLIFLVISCPCALVISVPLGYFGGIGLGSHNGILFKGSNFLEAMLNVKYLVTDKTGTITKGVFTVQKIESQNREQLLELLTAIEKHSTHPIAKAIVEYGQDLPPLTIENVSEIAGYGLKGEYQKKILLAGNQKLMERNGIDVNDAIPSTADTVVYVAFDNQFLGTVTVADEIKEDAVKAIQELHRLGVSIIMLSGDKKEIVQQTAQALGIDEAYGELLPDEKAHFVEQLKQKRFSSKEVIAFVGDGINDAPVIALSDVGIAMGGLGSDLAIETADVIIQTDEPSRIPLAMNISRATRQIVVQNIVLAIVVKIVILIMGVYGLASMWEAIVADVGVSLVATFNSSRLLYKKFRS